GVIAVGRLFGPEVSFEEDIRFLTKVAILIAQFLKLHQTICYKVYGSESIRRYCIDTDCSSTGIADEPMEKDSLQHLI
ncbi:MAG: hypothetical protein U9N19_09585, partial [Thermodesulfobacteriota bacterium]|nr:hypothetical protein [Thermodesulfobacteriota bacterium]